MAYVFIAIAGFAAFFLKGVTGIGTTTGLVAISTLIIEPKMAIVLASFVNIWGGFYMLRTDPVPLERRFWIPIAAFMVVGSVVGAWLLKMIANDIFNLILGIAFLMVSVLFFLKPASVEDDQAIPQKASWLDMATGWLAGFCGGFVGVNAPVLISRFGRVLNKQYLRRFFVLIFIPAAIAQTLTFMWNDLFSMQIVWYSLAVIPGMIGGVYVGNIMFHKVSDIVFKRILAVFLIFVSLKLIFL